jgi:hypothetical protein
MQNLMKELLSGKKLDKKTSKKIVAKGPAASPWAG